MNHLNYVLNVKENLNLLREEMRKQEIDILIVRSTDIFLNEYAALNDNPRYYMSGFTGTAGDMLITQEKAWLFVDGRYHTQADHEVDGSMIQVEKLQLNQSIEEMLKGVLKEIIQEKAALSKKNPVVVGLDPSRISLAQYKNLTQMNRKISATWQLTRKNIPLTVIKQRMENQVSTQIMMLDDSLTGISIQNKLRTLSNQMKEKGIHFYFFNKLEDIAYLTNMRGYEIPYNSPFKAFAVFIAMEDKHQLFVFLNKKNLSPAMEKRSNLLSIQFIDFSQYQEAMQWITGKNIQERKSLQKEKKSACCQEIAAIQKRNGWEKSLQKDDLLVGMDQNSINYYNYTLLSHLFKQRGRLMHVRSFVQDLKSIKTMAEVAGMRYSFHRSDAVYRKIIKWVREKVWAKERISETDIYDQVGNLYKEVGALSLSFTTISAVGKNSAVVHFTNPDDNNLVHENDLILIDSGAYFENGLATDCTRTFIAGGEKSTPSEQQIFIYTLVLRAALKALMSVFPLGTPSGYLDSLVRNVLHQHFMDFNHGTGHGIGINVHESPPRIRPSGKDELVPGMVFSVEPGIYLEGWGGIRTENIVCVQEIESREGWLELELLSHAPLDDHLIDDALLSEEEKEYIEKNFQSN